MNYAAEKRFAATARSRVNETKMRARDMRLMAGRNAMRYMRLSANVGAVLLCKEGAGH